MRAPGKTAPEMPDIRTQPTGWFSSGTAIQGVSGLVGESHIRLVSRAAEFAKGAHEAVGQRRKYTGEAYIYHPAAVADLVESVPHTQEMLAAAWLHDVVEDTGVPLHVIEAEFGVEVAILVEMLTDVSCPHDGLRAHRKEIDREHSAKASPAAKTIKLADLIDNTKSIAQHDPKFAITYLAEMKLLLEVLREGDKTLWDMAAALVTANEPVEKPLRRRRMSFGV